MDIAIKPSNSFYKSVFALALPMVLQNLINVAINWADVIMLGRVGEKVLSGAALAGQVQFILSLVFFGLTSGAVVLTAQYWGKRDTRTIEKVLGIALRFSLLLGLAATAAVWLFPARIMRVFTPDAEVVAQGVKYLRIISLSYPLISVTIIYLNIMRSVERVLISTLVYFVSLVSAVAINAVLIFGLLGFPALGIKGAAIGTSIARLIELAIVIVYARRFNKDVRVKIRDLFARDALLFRDFLRYCLPVTANEMMWGAGISMNAVIIGHLGSAAVAANAAAQTARQMAMVAAFSIANAVAIVIGKRIGEGNMDDALDCAKRSLKLTMIAGVAGSLMVLIARPVVLGTLNLTDTAHGYLSTMMFIMAYYVIAQAYNTTMIVGIFRAGGDTKFGLFMDVGTMWFGSILLGALCAFVFKWSTPAVYVVLMADELIKVPLTTWRYGKMRWLKNVTR